MASRLADSLSLVKRVEQVGWEVRNSKNGYRVKTPQGFVIVVHTSYSDRNSIKLVTRRLEEAGLADAEAVMAQARAAKKTAVKAVAAAASFSDATQQQESEQTTAQAQKATKQAAALANAAGPYAGPEDVHITWFAQKHPAPWMRWVWITPEIARYLLDNHNDNNRPLNEGRVLHYTRIILRGDWRQTHQGMAMDSDGEFQDGQHRLEALLRASQMRGEPIRIPAAFFVGMDPRNFAAIDEGGNRTAADLFGRNGVKYGSQVASIIRLTIAFDDQSPKRALRERQPNEVILNYFDTDPEELKEAAAWAVAHSKKAKMPAGPLGTIRYLLRRSCGHDNRYVEAFMMGLVTGVKYGTRIILDDLDPRQVARNFFENAREGKRRVGGLEAVAIGVLAWNNVVEHKNPRYVRFTEDSDIPRVVVLKDTGDNHAVYTAPAALEGELEEEAA